MGGYDTGQEERGYFDTTILLKRQLATIPVMIVTIALWILLPKISNDITINTLIATISILIALELSLKILK
ncbi:MAG TPA: hypothetical protein EYH04_02795 [Archaeoglobus profundus]|nr:hypothetical protein [Archaeoglobus profundus]